MTAGGLGYVWGLVPGGHVVQLRFGLGVGWGFMVGLGSVLIEIHGGFGRSGLGTDGCQRTWWVWGQQWVLESLHLTLLPPQGLC